ncbi:MAG: hypothetical protein LUH05_05195 [Candidatus Gastranaerophilales bacterium]|nr:hypothetical protein [Candidatus Gastranaerophilales bacterium]
MLQSFCSLTKKNKQYYDIKEILKKDTPEIDYLFKNSLSVLEKLTVIQEERAKALANLRNLTSQLQTNRLRYNAKSACKYFTL